MVDSITGWDWQPHDLSTAGERIYTLKRALNHRLGLTRANDALPKPLRKAYESGPTVGYAPDIDAMLQLYYQVRDWDPITARPNPEKLAALGVEGIG